MASTISVRGIHDDNDRAILALGSEHAFPVGVPVSDLGASSVESIDLADEPNDTLATATGTGILAGMEGSFTTSNVLGDNPDFASGEDVDLYAAGVDVGDRIIVDIDAASLGTGLDPILRLFDSSGMEIAVNDDSGDLDSFLSLAIPATDTYFVGVSGFSNFGYDPTVAGSGSGGSSGDYNLTIATQSDEPNDTLAMATSTGILPEEDEFFSTQAFIGNNPNITSELDVDLYAVELAAGSNLSADVFSTSGGIFPTLRLFDSAGVEIAEESSFIDFFALEAGTFFVGVSSSDNDEYDPTVEGSGNSFDNAVGTYNLSISTQFNGQFGEDEPNDTLAMATGTDILPEEDGFFSEQAIIGDNANLLAHSLDVDLYAVELGAGGSLFADTFGTSGSFFPTLRLFDASGAEVIEESSFVDFFTLEAGTFFVGISSFDNDEYDPTVEGSGNSVDNAVGTYNLSISTQFNGQFGEDEPNDTLAMATGTDILPEEDGFFSEQAIIGDNANLLAHSLDVDLYAVELGAGGSLFADTFGTSGSFFPTLRLFDASGAEVIEESSFVDFFTPEAGTFFVGISSFDNDEYDPTVEGSGNAVDNAVGEYNLTISTVGGVLPEPGLVIGSSGNDDLIAGLNFPATAGTVVLTGAGNDGIDLAAPAAIANIALAGSDSDTVVLGGDSIIFGGSGIDVINANDSTGDNRTSGGAGDDLFLIGNSLDVGDRFLGGAGDDTFVISESGANVLTGGLGADSFIFPEVPIAANVITDFELGTDILNLEAVGDLSASDETIFAGGAPLVILMGVGAEEVLTAAMTL